MAEQEDAFDNDGSCLISSLAAIGVFSSKHMEILECLMSARCKLSLELRGTNTKRQIDAITGPAPHLGRGVTYAVLAYAIRDEYSDGQYVFQRKTDRSEWKGLFETPGITYLIDGELNQRWLCKGREFVQTSLTKPDQGTNDWRHIASVKEGKFWCSNEKKWYPVSELHMEDNGDIKGHGFTVINGRKRSKAFRRCGYFSVIHRVYEISGEHGVEENKANDDESD